MGSSLQRHESCWPLTARCHRLEGNGLHAACDDAPAMEESEGISWLKELKEARNTMWGLVGRYEFTLPFCRPRFRGMTVPSS